jgi:hypothetical protein
LLAEAPIGAPIAPTPPQIEVVAALQLVAVDLAEYRSSEDGRRSLAAVRIRERAEFRIYVPQSRRM